MVCNTFLTQIAVADMHQLLEVWIRDSCKSEELAAHMLYVRDVHCLAAFVSHTRII